LGTASANHEGFQATLLPGVQRLPKARTKVVTAASGRVWFIKCPKGPLKTSPTDSTVQAAVSLGALKV